ncbi:hypothetical protein ABW21_db0201902 [Orbilia brochopaga]|nr:hypothetical protein ABW21_db0201902 [Drechslerella brochopaga]
MLSHVIEHNLSILIGLRKATEQGYGSSGSKSSNQNRCELGQIPDSNESAWTKLVEMVYRSGNAMRRSSPSMVPQVGTSQGVCRYQTNQFYRLGRRSHLDYRNKKVLRASGSNVTL